MRRHSQIHDGNVRFSARPTLETKINHWSTILRSASTLLMVFAPQKGPAHRALMAVPFLVTEPSCFFDCVASFLSDIQV